VSIKSWMPRYWPTTKKDWSEIACFAAELVGSGFVVETLVGIEGPGWILPDLDSWLKDPPRRSRLLDAIRRVETEPSLLGASAHILVVGRRH
jgi:hypothetical protein